MQTQRWTHARTSRTTKTRKTRRQRRTKKPDELITFPLLLRFKSFTTYFTQASHIYIHSSHVNAWNTPGFRPPFLRFLLISCVPADFHSCVGLLFVHQFFHWHNTKVWRGKIDMFIALVSRIVQAGKMRKLRCARQKKRPMQYELQYESWMRKIVFDENIF